MVKFENIHYCARAISTMTMTGDYIDNNFEGEMNLIERKKSERSCTDLAHLFMFGIFFTLWIGISVHAYSAGYQPFDYIPEKSMYEEISIRLIQCRSVCALFIWLAALFLGLYFMAIRFLTKYVIYATIVLKFVLLSVVFVMVLEQRFVLKFSIPILVICFIFYALTLYTLKKVGYKTVCIIIQESCKAMACHPSSIVVVFIYFALMGLVTYFISTVIFGLLTIPKVRISSSGDGLKIAIDPPVYVFILLFAFASCSVWVLTVIYNVGRTTLYGIFGTWYRTADKKMIPCTITLGIIYRNLRYHFGSLTFGSTIFTIVQIIRNIYNNWIDLYGKFKTRQITIFCFIVVLLNATSNTFMACVSYGTGYYRSMHDSFKLLMLNPLKFAATRVVTEWMIFFGAVLIPGLTLFFAFLFFIPNADYYLPGVPLIALYIIAVISTLITMVFLETFYAATTAILFCFLEDLSFKQNENDYDEEISA